VLSIFAGEQQQRLERAIGQTADRPSSPDLYGMRLAAPLEACNDREFTTRRRR
jgi:hypothetical protein